MSDGLTDDQRARIGAENEQRRLAYLYDATSSLFGEPLDVPRRLLRVAQLIVPDMGDWCWIDLLEGTELRRAVTVHWNPARTADLLAIPQRPHDVNATTGPSYVIRTGDAEVLAIPGAHQRADAPRSTFSSIVRVPLRDAERVVGVVSVGFSESNREHTRGDLALLEALATRAGWALQAAHQYEVATRAIAVREDILAVVAHDLRGPLGTVMLGAEALRGSAESAIVDRIERAGKRMERLISDLLDWAALESGHLRVTIAPVSARALIADAAESLQPQATVRELELVAAPPLQDVDVACDRARAFQVIGNLVGNAIKFTPAGGRITLRANVEGVFVRFTVEDEGPGIAPEHLAHIFERFWQAEPGTERRHGIGLGLAIASGIVAAHGGTIDVTSPPGAGARFSFTLPRA